MILVIPVLLTLISWLLPILLPHYLLLLLTYFLHKLILPPIILFGTTWHFLNLLLLNCLLLLLLLLFQFIKTILSLNLPNLIITLFLLLIRLFLLIIDLLLLLINLLLLVVSDYFDFVNWIYLGNKLVLLKRNGKLFGPENNFLPHQYFLNIDPFAIISFQHGFDEIP